eukprot:CAMPEP_0172317038 /NCGR_PEP_ID=MMETSP1058-20130122/30356_1 /TAXON_ID=83371 /ORGANISM="Detonula confervacea, Strain CCMP 353" /LENGTH=47 /DNA_ID= /DNA_START= /DNA_END= /DNA_ORIENTATION=
MSAIFISSMLAFGMSWSRMRSPMEKMDFLGLVPLGLGTTTVRDLCSA